MAEAQSAAVAHADGNWRNGLFQWLQLWANLMGGCGSPYGDEPVAWLNAFNNCYNDRGIPDNLTNASRQQMLSTLDGLQSHLLGNPGVIEPELFNRTMGTIDRARQELSTPVPIPAPPLPAMPGSPVSLDEGGRP